MMLLHQRLEEFIATYPDRIAVTHGERRLSFAELGRQSRILASWLDRAGVVPGDRVVLIAEHAIEAVTAFWAILRTGSVVVQLNPKMGDEILQAVIAEAEPRVLLTQGTYNATARDVWCREACAIEVAALDDDLLWHDPHDQAGAAVPSAEMGGDDDRLAAIIYTSGSAGKPKGVCLSHRNLWTVIGAVIEYLAIGPKDSYLMVVPLHYVHGIMQLLVHHLAGATVHLASDFLFPNVLVNQLVATRATGFSGVPFHFNSLIENSTFLTETLPDLRWLTVTGGHLDAERILQIRRAKPAVDFVIAYGQTECAPRATALDPDRVDRKPNAVGAPIRGVRVLILDEQQNLVPSDEIGEVVIAGDNVMQGYWRQPEATRAVIDDQGRLHTGDLGRLDAEGDLFLVGRRTDMIKTAGERIFPDEIEQVLMRSELVQEVVVVGVPDVFTGERVEAHLRLDSDRACGRTEFEIVDICRRLCQGAMPASRAPKVYHLWLDYPRKVNGKVDKHRLVSGDDGQPWPLSLATPKRTLRPRNTKES